MLSLLRVRQLAIIDELEIELSPGLNVITGETGAGKSILVQALSLVLGGRARVGLVRSGAEAAEVEALFQLPDHPGLDALLTEEGVEDRGELLLRRVVSTSGRTRAYVNGRLATLSQLGRIAGALVDITSQHAHHSLADVRAHLEALDAWAGLGSHRDALRDRWQRLSELQTERDQLRRALSDRAERAAFLRFQIGEIDAVAPESGEEDHLTEELARLSHAVQLSQGALELERELAGAGEAVAGRLGRAGWRLSELAGMDASLRDLVQTLESATVEVEEVARELGRYGNGLRADPTRLRAADERLRALRDLSRRYAGTLDHVIERRAAMATELEQLDGAEHSLDQLEARWAAALDEARVSARGLSAARKAKAASLSATVSAELADLGMGGATVRVEVEPLAGGGELTVDGAQLTERGMDRVELLISANPGEEPRPLREVASGGELSRALLALKRALAGIGEVQTYVFDEVDTGTGGAVAETIGRKLAGVGAHHQVLCITHLPQIAAFGERHLHVSKRVEGGRTRSHAEPLTGQHRIEEIARMIGGTELTDTARAAAEEMLAVGARGEPALGALASGRDEALHR
ncbi:MAG: DNA repair protein RecN [Deltaproteobacteria bacterium]|nr:DNA repair protein RecN [Deltaproteobacteria bacterium]